MASKSNVKKKSDINKDDKKYDELNNIISNLEKSLKEKTEENKKLTKSFISMSSKNKRLQNLNKSVETKNTSLSKQSGKYLKKEKESGSRISKLQDDLSSGKSEISMLKKENNQKQLLEKQEINRGLKELKEKEKGLEMMHSSIDKEIATLDKLKKDTKHSADAISNAVSKMPKRHKSLNNNNIDDGSQQPLKFDFDGVDKVLDKLGTIFKDVASSAPAQQITVVPIAQSTGNVESTNKAMEAISSYIEKSEKDPTIAPPQIVISPQTIITQPIEGSTPLEERDPTAMLSKPEESKPMSDMPVMRMKLDKDDDMYEDRLVITYTFDNMPGNKVYSKYRKILRNAVRITLLGNLQEGLDLFKTIKQQNLTEEYKSMIDKNISDITYYLRGMHRVRIE